MSYHHETWSNLPFWPHFMIIVLAKKSIFTEKCANFIITWVKISYNGLQRLTMVTYGYLDLSLDSILLVTILSALGSTMGDQKLFSTQIANLLLVSIIAPAMLTSINIACNRPLVVVGSDAWIRLETTSTSAQLGKYELN